MRPAPHYGTGEGAAFPTPSLPPFQLFGVPWAVTDHLPEAFGANCHPTPFSRNFGTQVVFSIYFQTRMYFPCLK